MGGNARSLASASRSSIPLERFTRKKFKPAGLRQVVVQFPCIQITISPGSR